jgi:biopolymer transport protein ExbD
VFRSRYFRELREQRVQLNLAPLIDMMFILLIFFLVTTSFVSETGIEVERPASATAESLTRDSILVGVAADGSVHMDNQEVSLLSLRARVKDHLRERDLPVIVVPDAATRSQDLLHVVDECKLAGAKRVNLAAEKTGGADAY